MKIKLLCALLMLSLCLVLLMPLTALALPEGSCFNPAVPPTTPSSDFTVIGDGSMVRHETTGLEWQRCAVGQVWNGTTSTCDGSVSFLNWRNALLVADSPEDDWRLPNLNELRSIVEECNSWPTVNPVVFPNTPSVIFWSASPGDYEALTVWHVDFRDAQAIRDDKSKLYSVRLVRGGP